MLCERQVIEEIDGASCRAGSFVPSRHKALTQSWLTLVHDLRRWSNVKPTLIQCLVSAG